MYAIRTGLTVLLINLTLIGPLAAQPDTRCEQDFFALHQALKNAGIEDAQAKTLPDYPHLGINRWLAFQQQQAKSAAQQQQWIRLSSDKAWQDLSVMSQRLPDDAEPFNPETAQQLLDTCLPVLAARTDFETLPQAEVEDSYATWLRVVGVYPVTAWLATGSIENYHEEMSARFVDPVPPPRQQYAPLPAAGMPVTPAMLPAPSQLANNSLQIPLPDELQRKALLVHYAPVLTMTDSERWNRTGEVTLDSYGKPGINVDNPLSYTWTSWTHFKGQNLLQLNYQFWFSQRPKSGALDSYGGELDGLIWRVTLKPDGGVLFYDSIHPCGCYHKIYPVDPDLQQGEIEGDKPVFYPQRVADAKNQRLSLLVEPDTHYLVRVSPVDSSVPTTAYGFADADQLRALPQPDGKMASLFNGKGLVPVSRRGERFYLWPMGVPSAGAMRQPGEHAIAFKGRRHFDQARLPETLFE